MWKLIKMKHTYGKLHLGFSRTTEIPNISDAAHIDCYFGIKCLDLGFRKCDPKKYVRLFRLSTH